MNKSNQKKYNKRIKRNLLVLKILKFNKKEMKLYKDYRKVYCMKCSYNLTVLAKDLSTFNNDLDMTYNSIITAMSGYSGLRGE